MNQNIYIIIPVYNRKEFTKNCLISLRKQTYKEFKVVVIDDGSTDGTEEMLINEFPEVHIIKGDGNLWWTRSINLGIGYALANKGEYVITLNNDTEIDKEFIANAIIDLRMNPNTIIGAVAVTKKTDTIFYAGQKINWLQANNEYFYRNKAYSSIEEKYIESDTLPGRGLVIPLSIFQKIGMFNEIKLPQVAADYEFVIRAKNQGVGTIVSTNLRVFVESYEVGSNRFKKKKSTLNFYRHLFSKGGGGNLFYHTNFTFLSCPKKYILPFLFIGYLRRILGYFKG